MGRRRPPSRRAVCDQRVDSAIPRIARLVGWVRRPHDARAVSGRESLGCSAKKRSRGLRCRILYGRHACYESLLWTFVLSASGCEHPAIGASDIRIRCVEHRLGYSGSVRRNAGIQLLHLRRLPPAGRSGFHTSVSVVLISPYPAARAQVAQRRVAIDVVDNTAGVGEFEQGSHSRHVGSRREEQRLDGATEDLGCARDRRLGASVCVDERCDVWLTSLGNNGAALRIRWR